MPEPVKLVDIVKSNRPTKKWKATFLYDDSKERVVHFGLRGAEDYTIHQNEERRQRYVDRHERRERRLWNSVPDSPAALSYWILWKEPSFPKAVQGFRSHFRL